MKKILIIDDERENRYAISQVLSSHYQVVEAANGREGISMAVQQKPDLILLDIFMPEMDGFAVCEKLREQMSTRRIPIVIITGDIAMDSRLKGFELGADDYICKPFHAKELIARVRARLRRKEMNERATSELAIGNLRIDPKSCSTWVNDRLVHLTQIEFDLLRYFIEHPGQVLERQRILGDLWPDSVVSDRTVDSHIAHLRRKIRGFSHGIETIYKMGYILRPSGKTSETTADVDAAACSA